MFGKQACSFGSQSFLAMTRQLKLGHGAVIKNNVIYKVRITSLEFVLFYIVLKIGLRLC
jgi:hypothetical protein